MSEPDRQELSDVLGDRREKLDRIREAGIDPFPADFDDREEIAEVLAAHHGLEAGLETDSRHRVAGRIVARRGHGKAAFIDLRDGSGQIQLHARQDVLGEDPFELLVDLDLGDLIGVEGTALATRRGGEITLAIDHWRLLAKSLRPPPDKFHGLEDVETRYRHRELDLLANEESRRIFTIRARAIGEVRRWLDGRGFVEVETPVLQPLYGGALARPFTTHHNALDRDLYLRIATELYLKRLIVGVQLIGDDYANTPPAHALARRGIIANVRGYRVTEDYSKPNPPARIIEAVAVGEIDVAIAWGPLAGYFARRQNVPLEVKPVTPDHDGPMLPLAYDISLGVRHGDKSLRSDIESAMQRNRAEIDRILDDFSVPRSSRATEGS